MSFRIRAWSHESIFPDKAVKVAFDNFIVNQGTLVPPVPEPSGFLALMSGVLPLVGLRRRTC